MLKVKLKNLVTYLKTGYQFREQIKNEIDGKIQILQMKDIDENNYINKEELFTKVNLDLHDQKLLINNGDILFRARGYNNYATLVTDLTKKTIVPSYFFIIRVNENIISKEYLTWFLNGKLAQEYFKINSTGSNIPAINKKALESLEIILPSLEKQNKITKINSLHLKEIKILEKIKEKKNILIQAILLKQLNN